MTRVMVVDDQQMFRVGLRAILQAQDDVEVVGEAANGADAVVMAIRLRPDVILMDVRMPELDGIEATRRITAAPAESPVRVVMLTTSTPGGRSSTSRTTTAPAAPDSAAARSTASGTGSTNATAGAPAAA